MALGVTLATARVNSLGPLIETPLPRNIYDYMPGAGAGRPTIATAANATNNLNVYWNGSLPAVYISSNRTITPNTRNKIGHLGTFEGYLPIGNRTYLPTVWEQWMGHQVYSSPIYVNSLTWPLVFVGDDVYSITSFNATTGLPISTYSALGQVFSTACVYNGRVYFGSQDGNMYCFGDTPVCSDFSIFTAASKTGEMWSNETLSVAGKLTPGVTNATIIISVNKPDLSSQNYTTTTDNFGNFQTSFQPNTAGDWGWVAFYPGEDKEYVIYPAAYTEFNSIKVTTPPTPGTAPGGNGDGNGDGVTPGIPMEYVYAAVAVIVIVVIAVGAYAYTKRSKK
jgi:hypothetical protein